MILLMPVQKSLRYARDQPPDGEANMYGVHPHLTLTLHIINYHLLLVNNIKDFYASILKIFMHVKTDKTIKLMQS